MSIKQIQLFFFSICFPYACFSQYNGLGFSYPLDRDILLTGNYGEIRPNHFHAGLDFSTSPTQNLPIKSVAGGYVSRIKISSGGYGRVLYVTHPNGYVTVYAHQKKYSEKIDSYVRKKQLEQKKNEIELFPEPGALKVNKGEVIGYTGNSGSSTGPHLHFEIREEKSEIPINPLLVYTVTDHVKPVITHVVLFDVCDIHDAKSEKVIALKQVNDQSVPSEKIYTVNTSSLALGFAGYDLADATVNKNNIYEAKVLMDGQLVYHHQLNKISFDQARFVNVFSNKLNGLTVQKCFAPACFDIPIYQNLVNKGVLTFQDTITHKVELWCLDERGNKNEVIFLVKSRNFQSNGIPKTYNLNCAKDFSLHQETAEVFIPAGALASNNTLKLDKLANGCSIGTKDIPVIKPFELKLKIPKTLSVNPGKLVMINNGNCLSGTVENGWLKAESKTFGSFSLAYDTVSPTITPAVLAKTKSGTLKANKAISFKINDNLSGIFDYAVYINEVWQIAEYDAKTNLLTCYFNDQTPVGSIDIRVEVTDKTGNIGQFKSKATR